MTTTLTDTIDVRVNVHEAYERWRADAEFCRIIERLRDAWRLQEARFHWQDKEMTENVEWDDSPGITDDIPDRYMAWQNNERPNDTGAVEFSELPHDHARITVVLDIDPVSNRPPTRHRLSVVSHQLHKELEDFKSRLELTGTKEVGA